MIYPIKVIFDENVEIELNLRMMESWKYSYLNLFLSYATYNITFNWIQKSE